MNEWVLFDGGGRGRPRSDRRAFVCFGKGLLFDGADRERIPTFYESYNVIC